ncbi:MAG: HAD-IA family hydrolase [Pseudomonadota bacterium]
MPHAPFPTDGEATHLDPAPPVAIFDLDGTLVDSARDLLVTLNRVLEQDGLPQVPGSDIRPHIGHGARGMIESALRHHGATRSASDIDAMHRRFLEDYERTLTDHTIPFPGIVDLLDSLSKAGARLGVCTNKYERFSVAVLKQLGLLNRFDTVVGPDTLGVRKPDPAHITGTIARLGGEAGRAVMFGDSAPDVDAAKAAGVPVIVFRHGYPSAPADTLGADLVVDDVADALEPALGWLGLLPTISETEMA